MQLRPASKRTLLIRRTLIVGVAALLTACSGGIDDTLEQTIEQKFDLALTGSLSVRNEDGSIHLYCSDRPGVKLQAVKRGYSAERMAKIRLDVSVSNDVMSIATIFPPKNKWSWTDRSGTVDYTLIVPQQLGRTNLELVDGVVSIEGLRGGSAKVSLRNGRISARNCFADLDFQSAGGTISFSYDWWEKKSYSVKATIGNGGVEFFAPKDASFRIWAKAMNGQVMGSLIGKGGRTKGPFRELETIIGSDPGPALQLAAGNGNIILNGN